MVSQCFRGQRKRFPRVLVKFSNSLPVYGKIGDTSESKRGQGEVVLRREEVNVLVSRVRVVTFVCQTLPTCLFPLYSTNVEDSLSCWTVFTEQCDYSNSISP